MLILRRIQSTKIVNLNAQIYISEVFEEKEWSLSSNSGTQTVAREKVQ